MFVLNVSKFISHSVRNTRESIQLQKHIDVFPADISNLSLFRTSVLRQTGGFFFS